MDFNGIGLFCFGHFRRCGLRKKKHKVMKYFLIFLIGLTLISCDPIKRHQRLVDRFPHVHKNDTIVRIDTLSILVPRVQYDTIVHIDVLNDTLFIERERLRVQIVRINDSIFVDAQCDTMFIEKIIEQKIPIVHFPIECQFDKWFDRLKWFGFIFVLLAIAYFIKNVLTNKK